MKNKIRVLYHSSIKIEDGKTLYFDPYKIKEKTHDADYIFITHDHYDHFSPCDTEKIINKNTLIFAPISLKNELYEKNTVFMKPKEIYKNDFLTVEAIHAYNKSKKFHPKNQDWLGYKVTLNNIIYYIAGDTDLTSEAEKVKCDIALVPVGGTYTMNFQKAAELVNKIKPKLAVPTHFGSIAGNISNGENFKSLLDKNIKCEILTEEF